MATRKYDPFEIPEDTKRRLSEVFKYWPGKTNSDLAHSLMSDKALECQAEGVFTVGNYYFGGIGHVCVDYGKVLRVGFSGIVKEAAEKKAALDPEDPETIVKTQFYDAVIITYNAAINLSMKWFPLPSVPTSSCARSRPTSPAHRRSFRKPFFTSFMKGYGRARTAKPDETRVRTTSSSLGRSASISHSFTASIPHPISTPTRLGAIAVDRKSVV